MIQIPRRTDLPTEPGYYLVQESGRKEPLILTWRKWSTRWEWPRSVSNVNAVGWLGPILGVKGDGL